MKSYKITVAIEIDAQDEKSATKIAADYKDKISRLVLRKRSIPLIPTRVVSVEQQPDAKT